jgi:hypothetical protein
VCEASRVSTPFFLSRREGSEGKREGEREGDRQVQSLRISSVHREEQERKKEEREKREDRATKAMEKRQG